MNPLNVKINDEQGKLFNPDALVNTFIEGRKGSDTFPYPSQGTARCCEGYGDEVSQKYHFADLACSIVWRVTASKPASLLEVVMVRALGLEPRTNALKGRCSTN
jgi:hypothetical protein